MNPIRRILVPTDLSDNSRVALEYAAQLARLSGARIDLLYVWPMPTFAPPGPPIAELGASLWQTAESQASAALLEFTRESSKRGIEVHSFRAIPGSPASTIADLAEDGEYDQIVIGTHGRTGLPRMLIGSVAERVVRHAPCTVTVVRAPASPDGAPAASRHER